MLTICPLHVPSEHLCQPSQTLVMRIAQQLNKVTIEALLTDQILSASKQYVKNVRKWGDIENEFANTGTIQLIKF